MDFWSTNPCTFLPVRHISKYIFLQEMPPLISQAKPGTCNWKPFFCYD